MLTTTVFHAQAKFKDLNFSGQSDFWSTVFRVILNLNSELHGCVNHGKCKQDLDQKNSRLWCVWFLGLDKVLGWKN